MERGEVKVAIASALASDAQSFGQEDDIALLSAARIGAR
jgi:hypothetical protein